jgi:hypothetical protein
MDTVWRFITDNQATLGWLAGGLAVVAGGVWAVLKFFLNREKPRPVSSIAGVAAGRDIRDSPIKITNTGKFGDKTGA